MSVLSETNSLNTTSKMSMKSSFHSNLSLSNGSKSDYQSHMQKNGAQSSVRDIFENMINQTVECLKSYDKHKDSESVHLEKYTRLSKKYFTFLKEVFEGVMLNYQLLSMLVQAFLNKIKSGRKEQERLMVISYLILFRFEDIKQRELNTIILVQNALQMHKILNFLLSKADLVELVFPKMEKVYDKDYLGKPDQPRYSCSPCERRIKKWISCCAG